MPVDHNLEALRALLNGSGGNPDAALVAVFRESFTECELYAIEELATRGEHAHLRYRQRLARAAANALREIQ